MITEDYVSFEVAKLLKEKGFYSSYCYNYYLSEIESNTPCSSHRVIPKSADKYLAPTHQMTMKWLREVYNLHIDIFIGISEDNSYTFWTYFITNLKGNMIISTYGEDINFKGENYEQTVDSAIKYCLTNLIK